MIVVLALIAALVILGLLTVLAYVIHAADQRKSPFDRAHNAPEHLSRSVLMYARRTDRPKNTNPVPRSDRGGSR